MKTMKMIDQTTFVVETNGKNEPGDIPAPFAGFVANEQDANALVELQKSWGLEATVKPMRGDIEIVEDEDGSLTVSMKIKPVAETNVE